MLRPSRLPATRANSRQTARAWLNTWRRSSGRQCVAGPHQPVQAFDVAQIVAVARRELQRQVLLAERRCTAGSGGAGFRPLAARKLVGGVPDHARQLLEQVAVIIAREARPDHLFDLVVVVAEVGQLADEAEQRIVRLRSAHQHRQVLAREHRRDKFRVD